MSIHTTEALANGDSASAQALTQSAQEKLRHFIFRIERIEEEMANCSTDRKEVYGEAKSMGFDVKAIRKVIALRKLDRAEREEMEQILELYLHAVGEV